MATEEEAHQAIVDRIAESAPKASNLGLVRLAEALAWLNAPNQPHGGGPAAD